MIDIKTSRGYTLPNKDNMLSDDVGRIAQALTAIDKDVSDVNTALENQKTDVNTTIAELMSLIYAGL